MADHQPSTSPRRFKFGKTTIAALPVPHDGKPATWWDDTTPGLGVRVSPAGRRTYFLQARARSGRGVKITIGTSDRITPDQARAAAKQHLAAIALDRDPAAERRARREAERERRRQAKLEEQAATVADLWRAFEAEHVAARLRPASQDCYALWYGKHIAPRLGTTRLRDLARGQIQRAVREIAAAAGQSTANRCLAVISGMLTFGEGATDKQDARRFPDATNCCRGIETFPEPGRERETTDAELARLIGYLAGSAALEARLLELALATGARRGELLGLQWAEISGSWWTIPALRSKSRKRQRKPLSAAALAALAKLDRRADPFAGLTESRLTHWWLRVRAELGLNDLRVHDLRHAAASLALNAGIPLAAVGAMLGHGVNSAAMTARYSHLADAELARAGDAVAERLKLLREATPAGTA